MYETKYETALFYIPRHLILPNTHLISFKSFVLIYFFSSLKNSTQTEMSRIMFDAIIHSSTRGAEYIRRDEFSCKVLYLLYLSTYTAGLIK